MAKRKIKSPNIKKKNLFTTLNKKVAFIKFIYLAFILNSINLIIVLAMQKNLPPQVPLFYGFTESEQQLTSTLGLLIPSAFSFLFVIINSTLSIIVKNDFLEKMLSISSFTISLLSLVTVVKIIFLVGTF